MEKEYYIVALNNNNSRNPMKLDNIISNNNVLDVPYEIKYESFDSIEVLAKKSIYSLKDVITGEVMIGSSDGISNGLSYYKLVKASGSDIVRITNKYKKMSNEDIKRYKNAINDIKCKSIKLYNEDNLRRIKEIEEEKRAIDYLNHIEYIQGA